VELVGARSKGTCINLSSACKVVVDVNRTRVGIGARRGDRGRVDVSRRNGGHVGEVHSVEFPCKRHWVPPQVPWVEIIVVILVDGFNNDGGPPLIVRGGIIIGDRVDRRCTIKVK
jgi:hypothetical protein